MKVSVSKAGFRESYPDEYRVMRIYGIGLSADKCIYALDDPESETFFFFSSDELNVVDNSLDEMVISMENDVVCILDRRLGNDDLDLMTDIVDQVEGAYQRFLDLA